MKYHGSCNPRNGYQHFVLDKTVKLVTIFSSVKKSLSYPNQSVVVNLPYDSITNFSVLSCRWGLLNLSFGLTNRYMTAVALNLCVQKVEKYLVCISFKGCFECRKSAFKSSKSYADEKTLRWETGFQPWTDNFDSLCKSTGNHFIMIISSTSC